MTLISETNLKKIRSFDPLGDKIELTRDSVFVTDVKDQKFGAEKY